MVSQATSVGRQMATGATWTVFFKIVDRGIGLVSTIVLARLLVPADFGLVALAMSVIAMLEVVTAVGFDTALVQRSDARREHFDTVWTLNIVLGLATGVVVVALAWPTAWLYGDSRLVSVMCVLGLRSAIRGFGNVGIIEFRRDLAFDREFRYLVLERLATTVVVTIPLAVVLRSYWALLAGSLAGTCLAVVLSYVLHPYRPRPSMAAFGELMAFSKWLILTSVLDFFYSRVADLIVGRWAGSAALGSLTLARDLARAPNRELAASIHRAVFPGYVKLAVDRALLRRGYLKVTSVLILVIMPASIGLSLLADPLVLILLGPKWMDVIPLLQIVSINGMLAVLLSTAHYVTLAVGMSRSTSLVMGAHACVSIPLMLWWVPRYGALGATLATLTASTVTAPLYVRLLGRAIAFGRHELLEILWRPAAGSLLMIGAVLCIKAWWAVPSSSSGQIGYVAFASGAGALVYTVTRLVTWWPRRDPESAETWMLDRVARLSSAVRERMGARVADRESRRSP